MCSRLVRIPSLSVGRSPLGPSITRCMLLLLRYGMIYSVCWSLHVVITTVRRGRLLQYNHSPTKQTVVEHDTTHKTGPSREPASKLNRSRAYTRVAPCQESLQSGDAPGGVVGPASVLPDSPGPRRAALCSGGDSGGTGATGSSRTLTALTTVGHAAAGATTESAATAG